MTFTHDHEEGINFWPVYSDLAMIIVLLLLLFLLTQLVANSKFLINETQRIATEYAQQQAAASALDKMQQQHKATLAQHQAALAVALVEADTAKKHIAVLEEQLFKKAKIREALEKRQEKIAELFRRDPGVTNTWKDGNLQVFTFSADVLFPPDQAALSPHGKVLMERFGRELQKHPEFYTRIEIEGHADKNRSRQFYHTGDFLDDHGNWRLSAERAIIVAQLLQELGMTGDRLAVVGRSFYDPVDPVDSSQAWAQNRRVQVRLFYSEN